MPPKPPTDDRPWIQCSITTLYQEIENASRQLGKRDTPLEWRRSAYEIRRQLYSEMATRARERRK